MTSYDDDDNNNVTPCSSPPPPTNQLSSSSSTAPTAPITSPPSVPLQLSAQGLLPLRPITPMAMATSVHSSSTSTVVLTPSSPASPSSPCHRVHFDQTCVLIPEASEHPAIRLTAKKYAIPTWARLAFHEPPTITVKLPSLGKPKHKPNHCPQRPLHPCLRHSHSSSSGRSDGARDAPDDFSPPISANRRSATFDSHSSTPVQTVPLRDCCEACLASVEKALQADYSEHFTKAAARRRRMSETDLPSAVPRPLLPHKVKVDEAEYARSSACPPVNHACGSRTAKGKPLEKPTSFVSPPTAIEEDENLLFPLPSPRRTPINGSPSNRSPTNGTPPVSSSPNLRPVDAPRPLSPCALSKALSETAARQHESKTSSPGLPAKGKSTEIRQSRSELSGKSLLQMYPDVDALPAGLQSRHGDRRNASESSSRSPTRRRQPGFNNIIRSTENAILGLGNAKW